MSLTLAALRAAIGAQLRACIDDQTNIDVDGEGAPRPRIRLVLAPSDPIDYWITPTSVGLAEVRFELHVEPANADQSAVQRLDRYLWSGTGNGSSVIDALMANKTLGGLVDDMFSQGVSEYDAGEVAAVMPLRVLCKKEGAVV